LPSASVGLVAVFEPPGVAFERECSAWWDEPVDHRGSGDVIAGDLASAGERLAGHGQARAFVVDRLQRSRY
jgi:hypothetical protein